MTKQERKKTLKLASFRGLRVSRGGWAFDPADDMWVIREDVREFYFNFSEIYATPNIIRAFKHVVAWYIENLSAVATNNYFQEFKRFLKGLAELGHGRPDQIGLPELLSYRSELSHPRMWRFGTVSRVIRKWHALGLPGVSEGAVNLLTEVDGTSIQVSTHRFRHLLNTAAHMAGMSNLDIAKWSGRIDIRQNVAYNHMTADQMLSLARDAVGDQTKMIGPLADAPSNLPITRDQFVQLRMPTGHITELGVCVHDYTMSPCSRHRDCIQCEDLVCVKGDVERTSRIRSMLQETVNLLRQAEEAVEQGFAGSRRWYEHHLVTVERLAKICAVLENSTVPDGAVLHLRSVDEVQSRPIIWQKQKRIGSDDW